MRRLKRATILSAVLAGLAITMFVFFVLSGGIIPLIGVLLFLVLSGFARKKESYEEYRDRYEQRFGMSEQDEQDS